MCRKNTLKLKVVQAEHTRGRGFLVQRSAPTLGCSTNAANEVWLATAPVQLLLPSTTGPQGLVGIRGGTEELCGAMEHSDCHIVGHCFYPTELCLFIVPQQGLLVTQIKGQLRH